MKSRIWLNDKLMHKMYGNFFQKSGNRYSCRYSLWVLHSSNLMMDTLLDLHSTHFYNLNFQCKVFFFLVKIDDMICKSTETSTNIWLPDNIVSGVKVMSEKWTLYKFLKAVYMHFQGNPVFQKRLSSERISMGNCSYLHFIYSAWYIWRFLFFRQSITVLSS